MAAVVDKAIIAETVVEPPKQYDIVLESHVGATSAAAAPAEFLALHGIRPPKPKAYRSLAAAMAAIITEVAEAKP